MIYSFLLSNSKEQLLKRKAEYRCYTIAKDLDEAIKLAMEKLREHNYKYCLILAEETPVKLIDIEEEAMKTMARWFK